VKSRAVLVGEPVISPSTGPILTGVRAGPGWRPSAVPASWSSRRCAPEEPQSWCAVITASVTEQRAMSITAAFTACEYSHSCRNPLQSSGMVVQLAVA
jgi:hypothetical protein